MSKQTTTITLEENIIKKLDAIAEKETRNNRSFLIEKIIIEYLLKKAI